MRKILVLFLIVFMISSVTFASENCFSDMENHWAKDVVNKMARNGILTISSEKLFSPNSNISICEFLKIIVLEEDYELVTVGKQWPDWYINTAIKNNIIDEKQFNNYTAYISRIDACKILARYINLDDVSKSKNTFSDLDKKDKDTVLKLVNLGVISGYKDGTFKGNEYVTRAQACKLIDASYNAKIELSSKRKDKLSSINSNLGKSSSGDVINQNRYSIKNNRIYIADNGRYAKLENATLNQEYINDSNVIKLLNSLADNNSYIALLYIPDKYTINSLNVCIGSKQSNINNGIYAFQIRFYENANYNLSQSTGIDGFGDSVYMRIELDKMWDKLSEYDEDLRASNKNLIKLEKALKSFFGDSVSKDMMNYLKEKLIEAKSKPNDEFDTKICETKKFGKYTFDILCTRDEKIQVYVRNNK